MASRLRGWKALLHDAVSATTTLVGEGSDATGRTTVRILSLAPRLAGPVRFVNQSRKFATDGVLATVRGVNRAVEAVTDLGLDAALPPPPEPGPVEMRSDTMRTGAWMADALVGAVNGVVGDHLSRRGNPLDLGMSLRPVPGREGAASLGVLGPKVAVWIHGLATTEWSWCLDADRFLGDPGENFGTLLQKDLGFTPVFVRYNTGRHVSVNGQALATGLERMVADDPGIEEIVLIGHSMGGLVARSACHVSSGASWLTRLSRVVCLGSPHQGAPLERFGHGLARVLHAVDLPGTRVPASILRARSDGIKDLGHGDIHTASWTGRDPDARREPPSKPDAPLLEGVAYAFFAGSLTDDPDHPVAAAVGDLLVQVPSAEGPRERGGAPFTARFGSVRHHEIQVHPRVYELVRAFCAGETDGGRAG